jgi:hypothetical protein
MSRRRVTSLLTAALLLAALVSVSACGSKSKSASSAEPVAGATSGQTAPPAKHIRFAKTKFLLHAGLAFGAFHRYLYKPFKAGAFSHPLQHKLALLKAAAAAAFVVHEVRKANEDAQSSALLRKLFSPLTALTASVAALAAGLKGGHADAATLGSANSAVESIEHSSSAAGASVRERAPALP